MSDMEKLWSERISEKFAAQWDRWTGHRRFPWGAPDAHAADAGQASTPPGRKAPKPAKASPIPEDWKQQVLTDVPVYPPFRQGLPMLPVTDIIQSQARLIREVYAAVGVTPEFWKRIYLPAIHNYAHYVHLLPASEGNHHRGAGGLFRHGLEACLYAVRLTDGQDSLEKSAHLLHPTERRRHEDALRLATFCAALFHDIGKPMVDMQVYDQQQGHIWNPALYPSLYRWGQETHVQFYNLRWRSGRMDRHKNLGMATAPHLMTRDILAFLTDVDAYWVETVLRAISGDEMGINKVRDFATYGDRESVRYDLKNQGGEGNDIGIPVERYLLDAMRTLVREQIWKVNESGAVLWTTRIPKEEVEREIAAETTVIALVWPKAATDVAGWLHQQGTPGIPKDPQVIADMLLDRELAVPSRDESDGQQRIPFWFLSPENQDGTGNRETLGQRVLVLRHPEYLLDIVPPLSARSLYSVRKADAPAATSVSSASPAPSASSATVTPAARPAEKNTTARSSASVTPTASQPVPALPQPQRKTASHPVAPPPVAEPQTTAKTSTPHTQAATATPEAGRQADKAVQDAHTADRTATPPARDDRHISLGLRILRTIIREILIQRRDAAILIPGGEEAAYLQFPEAFRDMGMKPIEMLGILNDEHLLIPSPDSPEKLTQKKTLPGQSKERTVVVLSPTALKKLPCLKMPLSLFPKEQRRTYHRYLLEQVREYPAAQFTVDKGTQKGYWFIPLEWVVETLSRQFPDDPCPERFLRDCTIGPGGSEGGGLLLRLDSDIPS